MNEVSTYKKSNAYIYGKFNTTLFEQQIIAIAHTRVEEVHNDPIGQFRATIYPDELKKLVDRDDHIYRDLKRIATKLNGHTILIEDGKGNFEVFSLIPNAKYENGELTIYFNNALKKHTIQISQAMGYTSLELPVMLVFKTYASFKLYEILKAEIYKIDKYNLQYVTKEIRLSELRFILGVANSEAPEVSEFIQRNLRDASNKMFWDEAFEKLPPSGRKYAEWRDFDRHILRPIQEELREKSYIKFEYEKKREGRFIKRVLFKISLNEPTNPAAIKSKEDTLRNSKIEYQQMELNLSAMGGTVEESEPTLEFCEIPAKDPILEFMDKFKQEFTQEELRSFLKAAKNETALVEKCIELHRKEVIKKFESGQPEIENDIGWIIKCIKRNGYQGRKIEPDEVKAQKEFAEHQQEIKPIIAQDLWEKITEKTNFHDFCKNVGQPREVLEAIYSAEELVNMYLEFARLQGSSRIFSRETPT